MRSRSFENPHLDSNHPASSKFCNVVTPGVCKLNKQAADFGSVVIVKLNSGYVFVLIESLSHSSNPGACYNFCLLFFKFFFKVFCKLTLRLVLV